jgi:hypothetical protein
VAGRANCSATESGPATDCGYLDAPHLPEVAHPGRKGVKDTKTQPAPGGFCLLLQTLLARIVESSRACGHPSGRTISSRRFDGSNVARDRAPRTDSRIVDALGDVLVKPVYAGLLLSRCLERLVVVCSAALISYLGFRLYEIGAQSGQTDITWASLAVKGTGPGLAFMVCGVILLWQCLKTPIRMKINDPEAGAEVTVEFLAKFDSSEQQRRTQSER